MTRSMLTLRDGLGLVEVLTKSCRNWYCCNSIEIDVKLPIIPYRDLISPSR